MYGVANPKKLSVLFYMAANPACGLLTSEKRAKRESLAAQPPPICSYGGNKVKIKHKARTRKKTKRTDGQDGIT